jgi:hypothetical protein
MRGWLGSVGGEESGGGVCLPSRSGIHDGTSSGRGAVVKVLTAERTDVGRKVVSGDAITLDAETYYRAFQSCVLYPARILYRLVSSTLCSRGGD